MLPGAGGETDRKQGSFHRDARKQKSILGKRIKRASKLKGEKAKGCSGSHLVGIGKGQFER